MKSYLVDASSLVVLIRKAGSLSAGFLHKSVILDLTYYEVGNALWKETTLTKFYTPTESQTMAKVAKNTLAQIDQIKCENETFQTILETAQKEKLSFYDSSYLCIAKQTGLILVTEDKELRTKAKKYINVQTAETVLHP